VPEHQLDDADVDAVGQQPARAFVPQVVPAQVDALELFAVPRGARAAGPWLVAERQQFERLPRGLDVRLGRAG
jgi:hypothetical protein